MKVLVVDDEPIDLKLAQLVLAEVGNEVGEATLVPQAMEEILRCAPDAILLDLGLPGIDGLVLARYLKRSPKTKHIAIIAVTAFSADYSRDAAMAAGCDAYIVKPINTRKLPEQIAAAVERPSDVPM